MKKQASNKWTLFLEESIPQDGEYWLCCRKGHGHRWICHDWMPKGMTYKEIREWATHWMPMNPPDLPKRNSW